MNVIKSIYRSTNKLTNGDKMKTFGTYYQEINYFKILQNDPELEDIRAQINDKVYFIKKTSFQDLEKHTNLYSIRIKAYEENARNGNIYLELEYQIVKDDKGVSMGLLNRLGKKGWV